MKRLLPILLCAVMCCSFVACSVDDSPKKESVDGQATEEKGEEVFGLNEAAVFEDLKFSALEIKESQGSEFFAPESGNVFVGIKFEIENVSDEIQTVSSLLLFEGYVDDVKCDYSFSAACEFSDGSLDGDLAPGKKMVGWYALEVPADWATIELDVQSDWLSNSTAKFVFEK